MRLSTRESSELGQPVVAQPSRKASTRNRSESVQQRPSIGPHVSTRSKGNAIRTTTDSPAVRPSNPTAKFNIQPYRGVWGAKGSQEAHSSHSVRPGDVYCGSRLGICVRVVKGRPYDLIVRSRSAGQGRRFSMKKREQPVQTLVFSAVTYLTVPKIKSTGLIVLCFR